MTRTQATHQIERAGCNGMAVLANIRYCKDEGVAAMSDKSSRKQLNEDLQKSYTHERPRPSTNPPTNREKPSSSGSEKGSSKAK